MLSYKTHQATQKTFHGPSLLEIPWNFIFSDANNKFSYIILYLESYTCKQKAHADIQNGDYWVIRAFVSLVPIADWITRGRTKYYQGATFQGNKENFWRINNVIRRSKNKQVQMKKSVFPSDKELNVANLKFSHAIAQRVAI